MAQEILDKLGNLLSTGDIVEVEETQENLEFVGHIDNFRNGYVIVLDQDDNAFCILPEQVKLMN